MKELLTRIILTAFLALAPASLVSAQSTGSVRLTLRETVSQARTNNPESAAALARVESARARIAGTTAWMAPMAGINAMNVPITSANPLDAGMGVRFMASQSIPWPGKLKPGTQAAEQSVVASEASLEAQYRAQQAQAVFAYTRLALLEHTRDAYRKEFDLVNRVADLATRRYGTGAGSQQDILRSGLEATQISTRLVGLGTDYATAAADLSVLLALGAPDSVVAVTPLTDIVAALERATEGGQTGTRPEVEALAARREAARARIRASRALNLPDVTVSAEYAWMPDRTEPMTDEPMDDGMAAAADPVAMDATDTWSVGVSISLPWAPWARRGIRSEEEAWLAEERALEQEERALRQRIDADLINARAQMQTARETLRLYQSETVPQANIAFESAQRAYQVGSGDMTALLDAWRALVNVDLARATTLAQYAQAMAAYALAAGIDLNQALSI